MKRWWGEPVAAAIGALGMFAIAFGAIMIAERDLNTLRNDLTVPAGVSDECVRNLDARILLREQDRRFYQVVAGATLVASEGAWVSFATGLIYPRRRRNVLAFARLLRRGVGWSIFLLLPLILITMALPA